MEFTTGNVAYAPGGPHSVEITVAGETKVAENILSADNYNEVKLISISLLDLGFRRSCIDQKSINSIVFVANSNDGLYVTHVEFFASFSQHNLSNWIDGDDGAEYLRQPVYP